MVPRNEKTTVVGCLCVFVCVCVCVCVCVFFCFFLFRVALGVSPETFCEAPCFDEEHDASLTQT